MILLEIFCIALNIVNLILAFKLKKTILKLDYINENQRIRRLIFSPVILMIILITFILSKQLIWIPIFIVSEVILLIALNKKNFEFEMNLEYRVKYIDINNLLFRKTDAEDLHINISKEFINAINSKDVYGSIYDFKYRHKFNDIQMNYLLESVLCKGNNKLNYNSYIYIYDELKLLELNESMINSYIKEFNQKNMMILDEYEILKKVSRIDQVTENKVIESSAYFIVMNYLKLKEDTTNSDEINYINYGESKSSLFTIYFKELNKYFSNLETEILKISLKALEEGIPIEVISNITGISTLKLESIDKNK